MNVLYRLSPLLQCTDVVEGVGYDKLETFCYYVSPLPIILFWLGILPSYYLYLPHVCVRFFDTNSYHWYDLISYNLVPMSPTVIIIGRRNGVAGTAVVALLFEESLDYLQSLRAVFKLFC
jgi:hypothetical protein